MNIDLKTNKLFEIIIPIYNDRVIVSYGNNLKFLKESFQDQPEWSKNRKKTMVKRIKKIFKTHPNKTGACYNYHDTQDIHYIHLFEKDNISVFINHASHEVLHFIYYLLELRGLKMSDDSEEAYAYLQGYVMEKLWEQMLSR